MRIALLLPNQSGWRCSVCILLFKFFSDYDSHVCKRRRNP
jgi:hypothetical protein